MPNFRGVSCEREKTSIFESAKLIEEMQELIRDKKLKVELVDHRGITAEDEQLLESFRCTCASCTACPCMICW